MVRVSRIHPGSIAEEIGLQPGTELLTINGRDLNDFLDWEFLGADEELVIDARLPNGDPVIYEIERSEGAPMGVELEPPSVRRCAYRWVFCFVEGLPPRTAPQSLHPRRRLPAVLRVRELRDALESA
jgi:NifB/MoaA-like Fe-S oxidoreductase